MTQSPGIETLRIAFWSIIRGWGGSELLWSRVAARAVQSGLPTFVCAHDSPGARRALQDGSFDGAEVLLRRRPSALAARLARKLHFTPSKAAEALRRFNPDVLVVSGDAFGWASDPELVAFLDAVGPPTVFVAHGASGFLDDSKRAYVKERFSKAAAVCFVAEATRHMIERHLACSIPDARIVRNPVNLDLDRAYPLPYPDDAGPLSMAMVSRINCYTKAHDYLLEALATPELRNEDLRLNIFGDGEHHGYVADLLRYYGLEDRVVLRGPTSAIDEVWSASHLHILPSLTESAPIALVEAMYCGRASVATRVGGVHEWIEEGREGFLAENATPRHLVPAIRRALDCRDQLAVIGRQAHNRAVRMMGEPVDDFLQIIRHAATGALPAAHVD